MAAYSTVADLLLGDMEMGSIDVQAYVDAAANEMDSKLGFLYALPLGPLEDVELLLLKDINNKLASGRIILAQYVGGEESAVHAYGYSLIKEANASLLMLANGQLDLSAEKVILAPNQALVPRSIVYDEESMVTAYENTVLRGETTLAQPGAVP